MPRNVLILLGFGAMVGCSEAAPPSAAPQPAQAGGSGGGTSTTGGNKAVTPVAGSGGASGSGGVSGSGGASKPPATGKLEPPDGSTLVVIGQDTASIEEYVTAVGPMPAGVMLYTNIDDLAGLASPANFGAGDNDLSHWHAAPKTVAIQVGLSLVGALEAVAQGARDESIDKMAGLLRAAVRPVFLRIGYEFDSDWAGYEPNQFKRAYQHIAQRLRAHSDPLDNVALVWHSWGYQHSFGQSSVMAWYPGDEHVDWIGVSLFPGWDAVSIQSAEGARAEIASVAKQRGKPFMIAEAAPRQVYEPARGADAWSGWYEGVFDFIAEHDVKLFSYINANWDAQPLWTGKGWGDTRVQTNAYVLEKWRARMAEPRFVHGAESLGAL